MGPPHTTKSASLLLPGVITIPQLSLQSPFFSFIYCQYLTPHPFSAYCVCFLSGWQAYYSLFLMFSVLCKITAWTQTRFESPVLLLWSWVIHNLFLIRERRKWHWKYQTYWKYLLMPLITTYALLVTTDSLTEIYIWINLNNKNIIG